MMNVLQMRLSLQLKISWAPARTESRRCREVIIVPSCDRVPYIVTYDHYMEEPGSLEVEYFSTFGTQRGGNDFHAFWSEFEYGVTAFWTTEFYIDAQTTFNDSTLFTGFRGRTAFACSRTSTSLSPCSTSNTSRPAGPTRS